MGSARAPVRESESWRGETSGWRAGASSLRAVPGSLAQQPLELLVGQVVRALGADAARRARVLALARVLFGRRARVVVALEPLALQRPLEVVLDRAQRAQVARGHEGDRGAQ